MAWFPSNGGTGGAVSDAAAEGDTLEGRDRVGFGVEGFRVEESIAEESMPEGLLDGLDFQGESTG